MAVTDRGKSEAAKTCTYLERARRCHDPAAGVLDANYGTGYPDFSGGVHEPGTPWLMCDRHLRPECHPPDLRQYLKRWTATEARP
jgi:hypothetical protein